MVMVLPLMLHTALLDAATVKVMTLSSVLLVAAIRLIGSAPIVTSAGLAKVMDAAALLMTTVTVSVASR